ncbi:hypothetical protein WJX84_007202 [Apatococcus fuscideae]|uniref:Uncharacterized protein n=1 Tax=Apatococcus fuscideae TaxID=2026836 RepID=A0AAW1SAL3_9CHLO
MRIPCKRPTISTPLCGRATAAPTSMTLVRIEFGGRMQHVHEFRRIVLRFKVNGPMESLSYEWYPLPPHSPTTRRSSLCLDYVRRQPKAQPSPSPLAP